MDEVAVAFVVELLVGPLQPLLRAQRVLEKVADVVEVQECFLQSGAVLG